MSKVHYHDYLQIGKILSAQTPLSEKHGKLSHDEMLFIITHQTFELWFKQVLFEIEEILFRLQREPLPEEDVSYIVHLLRRCNKIIKNITGQFEVLETMTALDFMEFRDYLHPASGFQSFQFRLLEKLLGLKEEMRVNRSYGSALSPEQLQAIASIGEGDSLFARIEKWLENMPFTETDGFNFWPEYRKGLQDYLTSSNEVQGAETPTEREHRLHDAQAILSGLDSLFQDDKYQELVQSGQRRLSRKASIAVLFIYLYRDYPLLLQPFRVLEELVVTDELMAAWRFRHASMASRMIGNRIGTGGSSGFDYLVQTSMKQRVFSEIKGVAGMLMPRAFIPKLPQELDRKLRFAYEV